MKLVGFCFEHLALFDWREEEREMYNVGSEFVKALLTLEEKGDCYTAMHDGRILVIGGIVRQSTKTGYAFTMFSSHAEKYPTVAAKLVKRMFDRMIEDMGLHRVVTYNLLSAEKHHKWCEWLGFKREGICQKFDDEGRDYVQYGKVL
jgi:hypothetical protein